ncbi:hypothetical protein ACJJTC_014664 [Scirpophaga incertulas]
MKTRDRLHSDHRKHPNDPTRHKIYNRYRNFLTKLLRKIKIDYYAHQLELANNNPKKLWKVIKSVYQPSGDSSSASELLNPSHGSAEQLRHVNCHFSTAGKSLATDILQKLDVTEDVLSRAHRSEVLVTHSLFLHPTDPLEVTKIITGLKGNPPTYEVTQRVSEIEYPVQQPRATVNVVF